MFGRAFVLKCQVLGFGPVQLARGSDRHCRMIPGLGTLSNIAARHRAYLGGFVGRG
jgi:hypothetical protein